VFRELPPSVIALDRLTRIETLNGGTLAVQYRYARRDSRTRPVEFIRAVRFTVVAESPL
jgi:hypothetical protein